MSMVKPPASRRCSHCDLNWPTSPEVKYRTCPECGRETWEHIDKPMDHSEAGERVRKIEESKRKHEEFEAYYAERDAAALAADIDTWGVAKVRRGRNR